MPPSVGSSIVQWRCSFSSALQRMKLLLPRLSHRPNDRHKAATNNESFVEFPTAFPVERVRWKECYEATANERRRSCSESQQQQQPFVIPKPFHTHCIFFIEHSTIIMAVSNDEFMLLELFDRRWLPMLRCATDASSMSFIHSFVYYHTGN